ncbi:MAG TPA: HAD-IA family hydrolase [Candidatus Pacearchaeota archaeon]|nr:HAD-IA family hydrolase [Candidatus Pacearchaeota archaeon]
MIKAILFDIDNTLLGFREMKRACFEEAIDAMIRAGWKANKERALNDLVELYEEYGMEYEKTFQKLLEKQGGKVDYRLLAHGINTYRIFRVNYLIPYPNVLTTLSELKKKYHLAVVTDAPRIKAWMRLVTMKLDDFFELVVTKGDVKREKTSETPFRSALRILKLKTSEVIMIGDRIPRDVKTPQKMGIKTVYARYGDSTPVPKGKSGADFEIDDISELLKIMKILEKRKTKK